MSYLDAVLHLLMLPVACLLGASPGEPGHAAGTLITREQKGSIMGYGKQTVQFDFPELSDPDAPEDLIYVRILNPRLVSQDMLTGATEVKVVDGKPVDGQKATRASYEIIAGLVRGWNVYDPHDESEDAAPFPMPATADLVQKLPIAIQTRLMKAINEAIDPK